jgi:hypothetical protein
LIAYHQGQEVTRRRGAASPGALAGLFTAARAGVKPAPLDRRLRRGAAAVLVGLAVWWGLAGANLWLAGLGAVVLFSAVYDRCPIYRVVSARVGDLLRHITQHPTSS